MTLFWKRLDGNDPYENLAIEEMLFDSCGESEIVLLLSVNRRCVVLGKHQNPWREIDIRGARRSRIEVARRISGGGTVYHDHGNLVFSLMAKRDVLDRNASLEAVSLAIRAAGVACEPSGTYDIYADGSKISGNAFCFRKDRILHHGTILIDADLASLRGVLKSDEPSIETHAVASRPAPTINLRAIHPRLDQQGLETGLVDRIAERYDVEDVLELDARRIDTGIVAGLKARNRRWAWIFGKTPGFTIGIDAPGLESRLRVAHGVIETVEGALAQYADRLIGVRFSRRSFEAVLPEQLLEDLLYRSRIL